MFDRKPYEWIGKVPLRLRLSLVVFSVVAAVLVLVLEAVSVLNYVEMRASLLVIIGVNAAAFKVFEGRYREADKPGKRRWKPRNPWKTRKRD